MEQQPPPTTVYTSTTEQPYMDNYEYTHTQYTHTEIQQCTLTYFHAGKPNAENSLASDSGLTCSTYSITKNMRHTVSGNFQ